MTQPVVLVGSKEERNHRPKAATMTHTMMDLANHLELQGPNLLDQVATMTQPVVLVGSNEERNHRPKEATMTHTMMDLTNHLELQNNERGKILVQQGAEDIQANPTLIGIPRQQRHDGISNGNNKVWNMKITWSSSQTPSSLVDILSKIQNV